jgi:hypothetical protein
MECFAGPDWSVNSGLDPHGTINMDGARVQNKVRHGVSFGAGSTWKVEARGKRQGSVSESINMLGGLEGLPSLAYIQEDFT